MPDATNFSRRDFLAVAGLSLLAPARFWAQDKPLPARAAVDRLDGPPFVSARGWAFVEGRSGRFLFGANETAELAMASTTKIMTAWLVLRQAVDNPKVLDEEMTISAAAAKTGGSSARIRAGDRFSVRNLLFGLLLPSGNDAATAFAEHFGPRFRDPKSTAPAVDAFVARMNRQATDLRLAQTRYFDPHGLGRNHTSARDLATLAWNAMQNAQFRDYVRTRRHTCDALEAKGTRRSLTWNNTNKLLDIEGYDGIKTGTTTAAGNCLVSSARRGTDHLILAVLGSTTTEGRYLDSRNLYRWAWRERGHK
ncbi:MAG: serine hydrolase [Gemmataceae bacterium]